MNKREALSETELQLALKTLSEWQLENDFLVRHFTFSDFTRAFAFMTAVAIAAEKAGHHPDWRNVYNRLEVRLNTHDAHAITSIDTELAKKINSIYDNGFR